MLLSTAIALCGGTKLCTCSVATEDQNVKKL